MKIEPRDHSPPSMRPLQFKREALDEQNKSGVDKLQDSRKGDTQENSCIPEQELEEAANSHPKRMDSKECPAKSVQTAEKGGMEKESEALLQPQVSQQPSKRKRGRQPKNSCQKVSIFFQFLGFTFFRNFNIFLICNSNLQNESVLIVLNESY